jgi:tRNA dimethylallyltransferase
MAEITSPNLVVILGPTASGKTALGVELARQFNGEIISADSRQVFKGMDLGTGKDLDEYGKVPYHLINIAEAGSEFSLFDFVNAFNQTFDLINTQQHLAFLVGGTGLYLNAILEGYQFTVAPPNPTLREQLETFSDEDLAGKLLSLRPEQHNSTDLLDRHRTLRAIEIALAELKGDAQIITPVQVHPVILGIRWPREILKQRITSRLKNRLASGMIEEVQQLNDSGVEWSRLYNYGLEYRFISEYLQGQLNYNDMYQKLNAAIHYFSKQQEKWFKRMERNGHMIHWIDGNTLSEADDYLASQGLIKL